MLCGNFHLTSTHSCYEAIIDLMDSTGGAARQGGAHRALPLPVMHRESATFGEKSWDLYHRFTKNWIAVAAALAHRDGAIPLNSKIWLNR